MLNFERGFRRISVVIAVVVALAAAVIVYPESAVLAGYSPTEINHESPGYESLATSHQAVVIESLGIAYFPQSMPREELAVEAKRLFTRGSNPELFREESPRKSIAQFATELRAASSASQLEENDEELVEAELRRRPELRRQVAFREFRVDPSFEKRPFWTGLVALGVGAGALATMLVVVRVAAWVARGFAGAG
jgi:hypothetical protein